MGVRAGVSDYLLPVPTLDWGPRRSRFGLDTLVGGLWLELKAGKGKPTPAQLEWLRLMQEQGYAAKLAIGWVEAARAICDYLGLTGSVRP